MARTDTERLDAVITQGLTVGRWAVGQPYGVSRGDRVIVSRSTFEPVQHLDYRAAIDAALDELEAGVAR
jgi:hypothetical protein